MKAKRIKHGEVRMPRWLRPKPKPPIVIPPEPEPEPPQPEPQPPQETVVARWQAETLQLSSAPPVTEPPPTGGGGGATATGRWEINPDGKFIDPDGTRKRLVGANGAIQFFGPNDPFVFNYPLAAGGGRSFLRIGDIQQWGWNMVRVCNVVNAGGTTPEQWADKTAAFVAECAAAKIVCLVVDFSYGVDNNRPPGQCPITDQFWRAMLDRCGDNPYFWLNYHNEPIGQPHPSSLWVDVANYAYNLVRGHAKGKNTMVVLDAGNNAQGAHTCATSGDWAKYANGKHHTVLSWHPYGANVEGTADGGTLAAYERGRGNLNQRKVPWLMGEYAYQPNHPGANCCGQQYEAGKQITMNIINKWLPEGESGCFWIATGDSSSSAQHSLRTPDGTYQDYGLSRSEPGQALWNVGRQTHVRS